MEKMELEEVYYKNRDIEYIEKIKDPKERLRYLLKLGNYGESDYKSEYSLDKVKPKKNDVLVIRGEYLKIGKNEFHARDFIKIFDVKDNSIMITIYHHTVPFELPKEYYKYFHLVDGKKWYSIDEEKLNYRKRFESLA